MSATAPGPVRAGERIQLLDVIRGFALLGILQVNFLYFPGGFVGKFQDFVLDGKMRTIYSFLFGLGFAVQLIRAEERGRPFFLRYLWRTFLLLVIGSLHFVFIWRGDILRDYAIMAVMLLVVRRARPAFLLALAVTILAFRVSEVRTLPGLGPEPILFRADPEQATANRIAAQERGDRLTGYWAQREHAEQDGGYFAGVQAAAALLANQLRRTDIYTFLRSDLMAMFLLGFYVGRRRILHEPERHRMLLRRTLWIALAIGVTGAFYTVFGTFAKEHGFGAPAWLTWSKSYFVGNDCFAVFYICALTLLFLSVWRWRAWVGWLSAVGRMGLTNYLMHSLVMTTVLYARGLGLQPRAYTWWGILILESLFVVQIIYSQWWLQRFQFGPVEWAWRSLTWLRWQPMRIKQESVQPAGAVAVAAAGL